MKNISPLALALCLLMVSAGLLIGGIWLLAGTGWALIAGAFTLALAGCVVLRGAVRGITEGANA